MTRSGLAIVCIAVLFQPIEAEAQHHHHHHLYGIHGFAHPFVVYQGYGYATYWPQPVQVAYYAPSMNFVTPVAYAPVNSLTTPSAPAARLKSLEQQARGDQRLREQKWPEARAAYANSVSTAPDRAEGHLRLGLCYVAIQRFDLAIVQIKLALRLDPTTPQTGKKLEDLFGPGSQIVRNSILSKLSDWVGEDIRSADRLFLLGVVLHFNADPRARDAFEAARRMNTSGNASHIILFLSPPANQLKGGPVPDPDGVAQLSVQPFPPLEARSNIDVRFPKSSLPIPGGPVPMPDGPVPIP